MVTHEDHMIIQNLRLSLLYCLVSRQMKRLAEKVGAIEKQKQSVVSIVVNKLNHPSIPCKKRFVVSS